MARGTWFPCRSTRRGAGGWLQARAADLARHLGLPVCHALRASGPRRRKQACPPRATTGMFASVCRDAGRRGLDGAVVVLVDDVCTTGATLEACARALKDAGVGEVRAVTAARVVTAPR
jgi:predicted amidophosphoribosyltransferase